MTRGEIWRVDFSCTFRFSGSIEKTAPVRDAVMKYRNNYSFSM